MPNHFVSASFHRLVAVLLGSAQAKPSVINVEAAVKTRGQSIQRVEDQGTHKRRSLVAVVMQDIGKVRQSLRQRLAKIVYMVVLGISSGQDAGVRGRS